MLGIIKTVREKSWQVLIKCVTASFQEERNQDGSKVLSLDTLRKVYLNHMLESIGNLARRSWHGLVSFFLSVGAKAFLLLFTYGPLLYSTAPLKTYVLDANLILLFCRAGAESQEREVPRVSNQVTIDFSAWFNFSRSFLEVFCTYFSFFSAAFHATNLRVHPYLTFCPHIYIFRTLGLVCIFVLSCDYQLWCQWLRKSVASSRKCLEMDRVIGQCRATVKKIPLASEHSDRRLGDSPVQRFSWLFRERRV